MTSYEPIRTGFLRAGARLSIRQLDAQTSSRFQRPMRIDIRLDEMGEYFDIQAASDVGLAAIDVQPRDRHLLLAAWNRFGADRFLCGHDERHWFVAALPNAPLALNIEAAKEALKPQRVQRQERRKHKGKHRRKTDVYMRQGEWFFIPCPHASIDRRRIVSDGLLRRSPASKPHICSYLYEDGEREYECDRYPKLAFFETEYRHILRTRRKAKQWNWRALAFRPDVYVKGTVEHEDHSPLLLDVWHRVELNRETDKLTMSRMIYRD
jgi:hypothetical protein